MSKATKQGSSPSKENIFEALRESHERQRSLCRKLLRSGPDFAVRRSLLKQLRDEESAHATAEERYLYAVILMDDAGINSARHALAEHHEIDEIFEDLTGKDPKSRGWLATAKKLSKEIHHHLKEEEKKFFQQSGKILSDTQKQRLAGRYRRDYARTMKKLAEA